MTTPRGLPSLAGDLLESSILLYYYFFFFFFFINNEFKNHPNGGTVQCKASPSISRKPFRVNDLSEMESPELHPNQT